MIHGRECRRMQTKYNAVMRKFLFVLTLALAYNSLWAKDHKPSYYETHDPSPDSVLINCILFKEDGLYSITAVDTIEGKTAEQLYGLAKEWIGRVYNDPKTVIKSENPPSQLVFEGQLCSNLHGRLEIKFKDGRIRWHLYSINMKVDPSIVRFVGFSSRAVEEVPKYSMDRGERGSKWLMADLYEFVTNFRKGMLPKEEDDW